MKHSYLEKEHSVSLSSSCLPSRAHLSNPPWWCTETRWAWQRQSYQSWWCLHLDQPSHSYTPCHWQNTGVHSLRTHTVLGPLQLRHLQTEQGGFTTGMNIRKTKPVEAEYPCQSLECPTTHLCYLSIQRVLKGHFKWSLLCGICHFLYSEFIALSSILTRSTFLKPI